MEYILCKYNLHMHIYNTLNKCIVHTVRPPGACKAYKHNARMSDNETFPRKHILYLTYD